MSCCGGNSWNGEMGARLPLGRRLLVTIGGTDPEGLTGRLVEALVEMRLPGLSIGSRRGEQPKFDQIATVCKDDFVKSQARV